MAEDWEDEQNSAATGAARSGSRFGARSVVKRGFPKIQRFICSGNPRLPARSLARLGDCSALKETNLAANHLVDDGVAITLAEGCPQLKSVDFRASSLTDKGNLTLTLTLTLTLIHKRNTQLSGGL